ncbi:MAG TPA: MBL fold metallo-hydrolase [Candidatus Acidoferrales bacterium]|nr:MBL fold metallo-hydrolase [Candidatus Acidoferrales bacterium]
MKIRVITLAAFGFLAAAAFLVTRTHAEPDQVKLIVPGVWFREGDLEGQGHCNNVIIEMKDYLIVVDANYPSGARLALQTAKRISDKPVKYVFDTHHHGDHLYGNPVWTQAGATTLAYIGVVDELKRYEPARWQAAAKKRSDVGELKLSAPEPPRQTFDKSPFVLKDSTREVRFYFYGWAHTRGDGFVYLPKEKVLCTGDAVVNGPYNNTSDANIGNWPSVIRSAQRLEVQYVLPGHGESGGKELLEGQAQFMMALHKAVDTAIKQGKTLESLVSGGTTTIALPDNVKKWVGKSLPTQVKETYEEITQKTPHGDIPH